MTAVTMVTGQATRDSLSDQDYRDIYSEVRANKSLDDFVALAGSQYSKAWWSKYERGLVELTRPARNELRRLMGLADLALTVGDALVDVDPDAQVWRIGELRPDRVILVGIDHAGPGVDLHVNGTVEVLPGETQACNRGASPRNHGYRRSGIAVATPLWQRLNAARRAADLSWPEFLGWLLANGD